MRHSRVGCKNFKSLKTDCKKNLLCYHLRMHKLLFLILTIGLASCGTNRKRTPYPEAVHKKWCSAKVEFKGFEYDSDTQPLKRMVPEYPKEALRESLEACVYVAFDVTKEGKPTNVRILKSFPANYGFESATARAILGWQYAEEKKKNVLVRIDYKLH